MRLVWYLLAALTLLTSVTFTDRQRAVAALPPAGTDVLPVVATVNVTSRLGSETLTLTGWAEIEREAPHMEGNVQVVDFEVVSMELTGASQIGAIKVTERPNVGQNYVSGGEIRSLQSGQDFPASSFFDVFADIEIPANPSGVSTFHNEAAFHLTPDGQNTSISAWPPLGVTYEFDPAIFGVDNDGDTEIDEDTADDDGDGLIDEDRPGPDPDTPGTGSECGANPDCDIFEGEDPPLSWCVSNSSPICNDDGDGQSDEDPACVPLMNTGNVNNLKAGFCVRELTLEVAPETPSFSVARGGPSGLHPADILGLTPVSTTPPPPVPVSGNNNFANAALIPAIPFIGQQNTAGSTLELQATDLLSPASEEAVTTNAGDNNGFQLNPTNAFADGGGVATDTDSGTAPTTLCPNAVNDAHRFFDFNIPADVTQVTGIEVRLDASVDLSVGSPRMCARLSGNGGTTWTTGMFSGVLTASETTQTLGGPRSLWRITPWDPATELTNANFRLELQNTGTDNTRDFMLDWVALRIYEKVEPQPCGSISNTVWYRVTPSRAGTITVDTAGSNFDTVVAVYTGSDVYSLTTVACDDDGLGGNLSRLTFTASAGTTYYIQAGGWLGATGNLFLNLSSGGQAPFLHIPCESLGLTADGCDSGLDGDQDDLDALSFGSDLPPAGGTARLNFSVGPGAQGVASSAVRGQRDCPPLAPGTAPEPEPDEFASTLGGSNTLVLDGNGPVGSCTPAFPLGLIEAPSARDDLDALDRQDPSTVDTDGDGVPNSPVYLSLDPDSPSLATLGVSAADVLRTVDDNAPTVYASASALGLQAGDDIDALCLRENGDGVFNIGTDQLLFSLAPGSPSLDQIPASAGDVLVPGSPPGVQFNTTQLGLQLTDDLDAVKCETQFKDPNGDTDGDGIPNGVDADDDNDGCADTRELTSNPAAGGERNPHFFWDFFDTPDPQAPAGPPQYQRDRVIGLDDTLRVALRFGTTGNQNGDPLSDPPKTGYHSAYDRTPPGNPQAIGPADGAIQLGDVLAVALQFGHNCA